MSLAPKLRAVLRAGTCNDLRSFLGSLGERTRAKLFATRFSPPNKWSLNKHYPLEECILRHDLERTAILFEFGASVETYTDSRDKPERIQTRSSEHMTEVLPNSLRTAVRASAKHRSLLILETVVDAARAQGRLAELIMASFPPGLDACRDDRCLLSVVKADFAPALAFLLDAGLPLECLTRQTCNHDRIRGPRLTTLTAAAFHEAPECLRLLRSRIPAAEWAAMDDVFVHAGPKVFDSLVSAIDTSGATPLPFEAVRADLDVYLARIRARDRGLDEDVWKWHRELPAVGDAEVAEVRAAAAGWDLRTRVEMYATLIAVRDYPYKGRENMRLSFELILRARVSAFAAAVKLGCCPVSFTWHHLMDRNNACDRAALTAIVDALAASAPGGMEDVRWPMFEQMGQHSTVINSLLCEAKPSLALFFIDVGFPPHFPCGRSSDLEWVPESDRLGRDDAVRLELAKKIMDGVRRQWHSDRTTSAIFRNGVHTALSVGDLVLAEAYLGYGVTIKGGLNLMFGYRRPHNPTPAIMLPPAADAQVEAASALAVMAGFDAAAARAHAAAAEAEEERLLAALLQDSSYLDAASGYHRHVSLRLYVIRKSTDWYSVVMPALTARWLWPRLCEGVYGLQRKPAAEKGDFDIACRIGNARCVRFFVSRFGLTLKKRAPKLPDACRTGYLEVAWALLLAPSAGHQAVGRQAAGHQADAGSAQAGPAAAQNGARGRMADEAHEHATDGAREHMTDDVCEHVTDGVRKHLTDAITALVSATLAQRCKFPSGLADALVTAGGRVSHAALVQLVLSPSGRSDFNGENSDDSDVKHVGDGEDEDGGNDGDDSADPANSDADGGVFQRAEAMRALRWALGAACERDSFVIGEAKSGDHQDEEDEDEDEDEDKDEDEDEDEDEDSDW